MRVAAAPVRTRLSARRPTHETISTEPAREVPERVTMIIGSVMIFLLIQQIIGPAALATVVTLFILLMFLHRRRMPKILLHGIPFLLFGVWAAGSGLWSSAPGVSYRYGGQLLITLIIGITLAGTIRPQKLPMMILAGAIPVFILSVLSGRAGQSTGGAVLIGLTGSKNQFGYLCLLQIMNCYALIVGIGRPPYWMRVGAAVVILLTLPFLAFGAAAAAQVQFVLGTCLFGLLFCLTYIGRHARLFLLACAAIMSIGLAAAAPQIDDLATQFRRDVLKKDATLTGRTELWAKADALIEERPLLGWGYRSSWLGDTPTTIGLLRWARLTDGRGFNFHNLFKEMRVDLGVLGVVLLGGVYIFGVLRLGLTMYLRPTPTVAFLTTMFALIAVVRSQTEMNISPFGLDTVLIFAIVTYATRFSLDPRAPLRPARRHEDKAGLVNSRAG
jgi:exopolysaccharide production protein ExoQ